MILTITIPEAQDRKKLIEVLSDLLHDIDHIRGNFVPIHQLRSPSADVEHEMEKGEEYYCFDCDTYFSEPTVIGYCPDTRDTPGYPGDLACPCGCDLVEKIG